ncbi:MAG: hypothetical protein V4474_02210 [Patescibacteria group bacterium]
MSIRAYLPSTQFTVIIISLALSAGLVYGAQYLTHQPQGQLASTVEPMLAEDWQTQLDQIQAQSGVSLPQSPDPNAVGAVLAQAKTDNLTQTVARSLLITLTNAKAQGLGDDIPTQDKLVAQALAQTATTPTPSYSAANLTLAPQSADSLHMYGNLFISTYQRYPGADANAVLSAIGYALDYNDPKRLTAAETARIQYLKLTRDLITISVPPTIAPLHLAAVNNLAAMAQAVVDIETVVDDPVRGLAGVQKFNALLGETSRIFTAIANSFAKDGILFSKDEPGSTWAAFSSSAQTQ